MESTTVLQLLREWREGNQEAYDRLIPLVYGELRRIAGGHLRHEGHHHSLQPTVLVHEAYLRLAGAEVDWQNRTHFLSVAATVMRRILVERARARQAGKRGGGDIRVTMPEGMAGSAPDPVDVLMLDQAIERLMEIDERQARGVELYYFGGLTHPEIGETLGISLATVERDLRHARAWLRQYLSLG